MSENLDLVRSLFAAWERGDWSAVDWADPEIEYLLVDEPGARRQSGVAAMVQTWRGYLSAWENYRVEATEYRQLDAERVLVLLTAFGRGRASGLDLGSVTRERKGANVFHIRDHKVTRLDTYFDKRRALADLGLPE